MGAVRVLLVLALGARATNALRAASLRAHTVPRSRQPYLDENKNAVAEKTSGSFLPFFQQSVPEGQQPIMELEGLRRQQFMDWPKDDKYGGRIFSLYQYTMLFLSLPISYVTFDQLPDDLPQLLIAANIGTFGFMILFIARLKFNWGYVAGRLKDRQTYYEAEERGLFAKKDKGSRVRDRLVFDSEVAPVVERVNQSLIAVALALVLTLGTGEALTLSLGEAGPATLKTLTGDEAIRFNNKLRYDDNFARREQKRAQRGMQEDGSGGKPAYCDSRYYKILAGGNGQGGVGCQ